MTLKWIYAAVVVAAALVLGLALQDGRTEHEVANSRPAPEPRVVGGGRSDLPLPAPRALPSTPVTDADPAAMPEQSVSLSASGALEEPAEAIDVPEEIAAQTPSVVQRSVVGGSGAPSSRRSSPQGGGGGAVIADAPSAPAAPRIPEVIAAEPVAVEPVAETPGPIANAPAVPADSGPALPELEGTPPDQRPAVLDLVKEQNAQKRQTALGLVGASPRKP